MVKILKQHKAGISIKELCKENGINAASFYNWKGKYGGMNASQLKKLKEMESEISHYMQMYAELSHQNYALKDLVEKSSRADREMLFCGLFGKGAQIES